MENVLLPISVPVNQDSQDQIVIEVGETEQDNIRQDNIRQDNIR